MSAFFYSFLIYFTVCLIKVEQRRGNLYWVSCDQNSIGITMAEGRYSQQLYQSTREIRNLYLDWLGGDVMWLEEERIIAMSMMGGQIKDLVHLKGGVRGNIAFDIRANSLLWNSEQAGPSLLLIGGIQSRFCSQMSLNHQNSDCHRCRIRLSVTVAAHIPPVQSFKMFLACFYRFDNIEFAAGEETPRWQEVELFGLSHCCL